MVRSLSGLVIPLAATVIMGCGGDDGDATDEGPATPPEAVVAPYLEAVGARDFEAACQFHTQAFQEQAAAETEDAEGLAPQGSGCAGVLEAQASRQYTEAAANAEVEEGDVSGDTADVLATLPEPEPI